LNRIDPQPEVGERLATTLIRDSDIEEVNMGLAKTIYSRNGTPVYVSLGAVCGLQDGVSGTGTCSVRMWNKDLQKREEDAQARDKARNEPAAGDFDCRCSLRFEPL
jgi:hypothetical protein